MARTLAHYLIGALVLLVLLAIGLIVFVYSGAYYIGADRPHTRPVLSLMRTLREHAIESHAEAVRVPANLGDPAVIAEGAGHYDRMCTGCHLKPGEASGQLHTALYPQPPRLAGHKVEPGEAFWVIKHGIKMTAMPAWGEVEGDEELWSIVAFLQKLPSLDARQYRAMVAASGAHAGAADDGSREDR